MVKTKKVDDAVKFIVTRYELFELQGQALVKAMLESIRTANRPTLDVTLQKERIQERIDMIEASMVQADTYADNVGGFNNGKRENVVEKKILKRLELKEMYNNIVQLQIRYAEELEILNDKARTIIEFACDGSNDYIETLVCYYIHCKSIEYIAQETGYTIQTIFSRKRRGIAKIVKALNV